MLKVQLPRDYTFAYWKPIVSALAHAIPNTVTVTQAIGQTERTWYVAMDITNTFQASLSTLIIRTNLSLCGMTYSMSFNVFPCGYLSIWKGLKVPLSERTLTSTILTTSPGGPRQSHHLTRMRSWTTCDNVTGTLLQTNHKNLAPK